MLWEAISYTTRTALVHIRGILTIQQYIDEIIQSHTCTITCGSYNARSCIQA